VRHLAYLAYFVLLGVERDAHLQGVWGHHLAKMERKFRLQGNSFFSFVYASYFPLEEEARQRAVQTLKEFECPKPQRSVINSRDPAIPKSGRWSLQPLPVWKRPNTDIVWQRDPYELDAIAGHRNTGVDFLLAYWMGRHLGAISPEE
jgi:hypothetical protein